MYFELRFVVIETAYQPSPFEIRHHGRVSPSSQIYIPYIELTIYSYWVSKKQYWCKYCNIFVRDDAPVS